MASHVVVVILNLTLRGSARGCRENEDLRPQELRPRKLNYLIKTIGKKLCFMLTLNTYGVLNAIRSVYSAMFKYK